MGVYAWWRTWNDSDDDVNNVRHESWLHREHLEIYFFNRVTVNSFRSKNETLFHGMAKGFANRIPHTLKDKERTAKI